MVAIVVSRVLVLKGVAVVGITSYGIGERNYKLKGKRDI